MTGYGIAGPHLADDHSLDAPDGWDDDIDARAEQLLDDADTYRKGEA